MNFLHTRMGVVETPLLLFISLTQKDTFEWFVGTRTSILKIRNMQKQITLILIVCFLGLFSNAQVTAFKLPNKGSSITGGESEISILKKRYRNNQKLNEAVDEISRYQLLKNEVKKKQDSVKSLQVKLTPANGVMVLKDEERKEIIKQIVTIENRIKSLIPEIEKAKTKKFRIYKATNEIIDHLYLKEKIKLMSDTIKLYQQKLFDDNGTLVLTLEEREELKQKINVLEDSIGSKMYKADSLLSVYEKEYIQYRNLNMFLTPREAKAFFTMAYDDTPDFFKPLSNAGLSFGTNTGALYSEIVSGNLALFRVTLGTMVSKSGNDDPDKEKQEEAYQRLVSYGGNTVLSFEYPFAYIHSNDNRYNVIGRAMMKGTADFPAFGTTSESWAGSLSYGLDVYADATLRNRKLRFFGNFNYSRFHGTDVFKTNLGTANVNFNFGQLTLGLVFLDNFKLSFVVSTFSNESALKNKKVVAGGQVLR